VHFEGIASRKCSVLGFRAVLDVAVSSQEGGDMQGRCLRSKRDNAATEQNRTPIPLREREMKEDDPDGHRESSPSQMSTTTALAVKTFTALSASPSG